MYICVPVWLLFVAPAIHFAIDLLVPHPYNIPARILYVLLLIVWGVATKAVAHPSVIDARARAKVLKRIEQETMARRRADAVAPRSPAGDAQ